MFIRGAVEGPSSDVPMGGWIMLSRGTGRKSRLCLAIATLAVVALVLPVTALAATYSWSGESEEEIGWSEAANWQGGVAPFGSVSLEFPKLSTCDTAEESFEEEGPACYFSGDDLPELNVESIAIDDSRDYIMFGEEGFESAMRLGAGGLSATPSEYGSSAADDLLLLPISLQASQTWLLKGSGAVARNRIALLEPVRGPGQNLTIDLADDGWLDLADEVEAGSVSVVGANESVAGIFNGVLNLAGGDLNGAGGGQVSLRHVFAIGYGNLGALNTQAATIDVGKGANLALEATSAALDSASEIQFNAAQASSGEEVAMTHLTAAGNVSLGGAKLVVQHGPYCLTLPAGHMYTLVSTSGELTGTFVDAGENGSDLPVTSYKECTAPEQHVRIEYDTSGSTKSVTAMVAPAATSTLLQTAGSAPKRGEAVTFTATVAYPSAVNGPPGTVEFLDAGAPISGCESAALSPHELVSTASCTTSYSSAGSYTITARYAGGTDFTPSTSAPETVTVQPAAKKHRAGVARLVGHVVKVSRGRVALVKLRCKGHGACDGHLVILLRRKVRHGKHKHVVTLRIGGARYAIKAGSHEIVRARLDRAGRRAVSSRHRQVHALLRLRRDGSSKAPSFRVRLLRARAPRKRHG